MSELSACPFCGAAPILHPMNDYGHQPVECPTLTCPMHVVWPSVEGWNRRAAPPAVGREPVADDVPLLFRLRALQSESPTPIDGERWNDMARAMQRIGAAGSEEEIEKLLRDSYSDSSASPERQTDETGKAGSDGAVTTFLPNATTESDFADGLRAAREGRDCFLAWQEAEGVRVCSLGTVAFLLDVANCAMDSAARG